jgi:hypothetical protein
VKRLSIILALLLWSTALFAQKEIVDDHGRRPYYGYIISANTREPIRNTHVISKMAHCGTISNMEGRFVIPAKSVDTLWVSCVGYSRRLIAIDSTMAAGRDTLLIALRSDTITLREVTIMPFYDYKTFKEMLITMPSIETPRELQRLEEELDELWMSRTPAGNGMVTVTANPIQFLYDKYNKSARTQARLLRNRRMYNEVLREQGRTDELLPDSLDYPINYSVFQLDEAAETGDKPMVPRKKYLRLGQ